MIYLYIKPEVKKFDTVVMTTAINEACIGWLYENHEKSFFFAAGQNSPFIYRISPEGLGEGAGQPIYGVGSKQDKRSGNIFGKMGDTGGKIQRKILLENVLYKGFNSTERFQISCDYET